MTDATAYPLQWPLGRPRAKSRRPAPFRTTMGAAFQIARWL